MSNKDNKRVEILIMMAIQGTELEKSIFPSKSLNLLSYYLIQLQNMINLQVEPLTIRDELNLIIKTNREAKSLATPLIREIRRYLIKD